MFLQNLCDRICDDHYKDVMCDTTDSIIPYEELWRKSESFIQSESDFRVILQQLVMQKKIIIHKENTEVVSWPHVSKCLIQCDKNAL